MRVEIDLQITFKTPFCIGSGAMADSLAKKPMLKDARRRPVLPGSTLKGRLRHECERVVRALTQDDDTVSARSLRLTTMRSGGRVQTARR